MSSFDSPFHPSNFEFSVHLSTLAEGVLWYLPNSPTKPGDLAAAQTRACALFGRCCWKPHEVARLPREPPSLNEPECPLPDVMLRQLVVELEILSNAVNSGDFPASRAERNRATKAVLALIWIALGCSYRRQLHLYCEWEKLLSPENLLVVCLVADPANPPPEGGQPKPVVYAAPRGFGHAPPREIAAAVGDALGMRAKYNSRNMTIRAGDSKILFCDYYFLRSELEQAVNLFANHTGTPANRMVLIQAAEPRDLLCSIANHIRAQLSF